jgi:cobalamin biosynthesis protein CobT
MTTAPLILGLKHRLSTERPNTSGYSAFTTSYDEVLTEDELAKMHADLSAEEKSGLTAAMDEFESSFAAERIKIAEAGGDTIQHLKASINEQEREGTVVSFLIDHSGSMKGLRMVSALLALETAVDVLRNSNIATEILGFTTKNWLGGNARKAWQWAGRPSNLGRLCELRHIVYSSVDRSPTYPWLMRMAFLPSILKENIDGEALEWAAERLRHSDWKRRVIILLSDGAPIDDATLMTNENEELLWGHLADVQSSLEGEGFVLGTLLIGGEDVPEPFIFERADGPAGAARSMLDLLSRALTK